MVNRQVLVRGRLISLHETTLSHNSPPDFSVPPINAGLFGQYLPGIFLIRFLGGRAPGALLFRKWQSGWNQFAEQMNGRNT